MNTEGSDRGSVSGDEGEESHPKKSHAWEPTPLLYKARNSKEPLAFKEAAPSLQEFCYKAYATVVESKRALDPEGHEAAQHLRPLRPIYTEPMTAPQAQMALTELGLELRSFISSREFFFVK